MTDQTKAPPPGERCDVSGGLVVNDLEEAVRLAEVGEFLYDRAYSYGDGQTEPREFGVQWDWQQSKPGEHGQGVLLKEANDWHDQMAEDGVVTEARKLRAALQPPAASEGGEPVAWNGLGEPPQGRGRAFIEADDPLYQAMTPSADAVAEIERLETGQGQALHSARGILTGSAPAATVGGVSERDQYLRDNLDTVLRAVEDMAKVGIEIAKQAPNYHTEARDRARIEFVAEVCRKWSAALAPTAVGGK